MSFRQQTCLRELNVVRVHPPELWDPVYPKIHMHWYSSRHTGAGRPVLWRAGASIVTRSQGLPSLGVGWKLLFQRSRAFGPGFSVSNKEPLVLALPIFYFEGTTHTSLL